MRFELIEETCPHCDHFNEYRDKPFGWATCKECHRKIKLCNVCPLDLDTMYCTKDCPLGPDRDEKGDVNEV